MKKRPKRNDWIAWPPRSVHFADEMLFGGGVSVYFDGKLVGKCKDRAEAEWFLSVFMASAGRRQTH